MGTNSKIEWTDHTWNPWQGCTPVSAGCDNCYMFRDKRRWSQDPTKVVRSSRQTFESWVRDLRDQCQAARVPFFFKQWGEWKPAIGKIGGTLAWVDEENEGQATPSRNVHNFLGGYLSVKTGKKKAGRLLDAREWNEFPRG